MAGSFDSFGSSRFPLIPTAAMHSAAHYDPGLATIIALVSAAVEADIGAAWRSMVQQLDATSFLHESIAPIGSVLTVLPTPQNLTQIKSEWPLLAVYREGTPARAPITIDYPAFTQNWAIDWIVGPLGPDTQRKIGHFWVQVRNSIWTAIETGHHLSFEDGAYQFFGQFVSIMPTGAEGPGVTQELSGGKGDGYFGGSVTLESVERLTYQNKATGDTFNQGGYLPPGDGYGDEATSLVLDVDFDNRTPPTVPIEVP